jgi:hypothetical protein
MGIEWIYLGACLIVGYCAYHGGKGDGLNLGIEHTLDLLEKHKMINIDDPKFDQIFAKQKVDNQP